jgi:hypothetical protein
VTIGRVVAGHELVQVGAAQRVLLEGEIFRVCLNLVEMGSCC